jgi:hypothetical protein
MDRLVELARHRRGEELDHGAHAGIVVEPTEGLIRLQQELLDAVAPFTEKTGTPAAFASTEGGRDIQPGLIDYVANFVTVAAGKKFNPHVTIGVAPQSDHAYDLPRQDVRRAVRGVHVCAGRRGGLPARHFWHGSQGTSDVPANALTHGNIVIVEDAHGDGAGRPVHVDDERDRPSGVPGVGEQFANDASRAVEEFDSELHG